MHKPLHPYFKLGKILFIGSAIILMLLDNFIPMAISKRADDVALFLSSLSKVNFVFLAFSALLTLIGLWESRQDIATKAISKRTTEIQQLDPEDYAAFEAWLELDLAHKHLRKSAQVKQFLIYKKTQNT